MASLLGLVASPDNAQFGRRRSRQAGRSLAVRDALPTTEAGGRWVPALRLPAQPALAWLGPKGAETHASG